MENTKFLSPRTLFSTQTLTGQHIEEIANAICGLNKRKQYVLCIDVETANSLDCPLVYDLGFAISDKQGNRLYEKSLLIEEIFTDKQLMSTAYYAEKVPAYWIDLYNGDHEMVKWDYALTLLNTVAEAFNVKIVGAYNWGFDRRALTKTNRTLNGKAFKFDPEKIKELCIWSLACETIFQQKTYAKLAIANEWLTPASNLRTNAECAYRYLTKDVNFIEAHTGLQDVRIETEIMAKCFKVGRNLKSGVIGSPWRMPNGKGCHSDLLDDMFPERLNPKAPKRKVADGRKFKKSAPTTNFTWNKLK